MINRKVGLGSKPKSKTAQTTTIKKIDGKYKAVSLRNNRNQEVTSGRVPARAAAAANRMNAQAKRAMPKRPSLTKTAAKGNKKK